MERDQVVARDFLGLGSGAGADMREPDKKRLKDGGLRHGEHDVGMGMSGHGLGKLVKQQPGVMQFHDAQQAQAQAQAQHEAAAAAARSRQANELHLAFPHNGRGFRGQGFPPGMGALGKGSAGGVPAGHAMPDFQGQWMDKAQQSMAGMQQAHNNFAFDRSALRDLKDRGPGNYPSREDVLQGSFEAQQNAHMAMAASQAQFAAASRRFAVPPSTLATGARPMDDRNTMARSAERPGPGPGVHDSGLSLAMAGARDHAVPVPNFRIPPGAAGMSNGASASPGPGPGSLPNGSMAMAAPRPPANFASNAAGSPLVARPTTSNSPGRPLTAQLTIFYAGSVNVYDDVPSDKAQAIMLLAGSGSSWSTSIINTPAPQSSPNAGSTVGSQFSRPESHVTVAGPLHSAQMQHQAAARLQPSASGAQCSVSLSPPGSSAMNQCAGSAANQTTTAIAANQTAGSAAGSPQDPASANPALSQAQGARRGQNYTGDYFVAGSQELPQARKASLARFLEKRKERSTVARQKPAYPDKKEGSPTFSKPPSPPKSSASSPPRSMPDAANSSAASSQVDGNDTTQHKAQGDNEEPADRGEEGQSCFHTAPDHKRKHEEESGASVR